MLNIKYEDWKTICEAYDCISMGKKKAYLQWYPFSNKKILRYASSKDFFNKYIITGYFLLDDQIIEVSKHYLQKSDGTYRDAQLISPIFYLIIQTLCFDIFRRCDVIDYKRRSSFYSGSFEELNLTYSKFYDDFFKQINYYSELFRYFLKLDIRDFFRNINLDILFNEINDYCSGDKYSENDLFIMKEILKYSGNGKFPVHENSTGLSFLATEVYLKKPDFELFDFLSGLNKINKFRLVRYVDDLYIFFDCSENENLNIICSDIISKFSTILSKKNLTLNSNKVKYGLTKNIGETLKNSLYDEIVNGENFELHDYAELSIDSFIMKMNKIIKDDGILIKEKYDKLVDEEYSSEEYDLSSSELYKKLVFNINQANISNKSIKYLLEINNVENYRFDTKILITLLLKTRSGNLIKNLLNQLFKKSRESEWDNVDFHIAIIYLQNRGFVQIDLLKYIYEENKSLYQYINLFCIGSLGIYENSMVDNYFKLGIPQKTMILFFLYLSELKKNNIFSAFAYFKSYFDSMSADIDFFDENKDGQKLKKRRYERFYKEKNLKQFYNLELKDKPEVIQIAHELRNSNPINHASAGLLNRKILKEELLESITELKRLIVSKIEHVLSQI